jgi:hypothetical protein
VRDNRESATAFNLIEIGHKAGNYTESPRSHEMFSRPGDSIHPSSQNNVRE